MSFGVLFSKKPMLSKNIFLKILIIIFNFRDRIKEIACIMKVKHKQGMFSYTEEVFDFESEIYMISLS